MASAIGLAVIRVTAIAIISVIMMILVLTLSSEIGYIKQQSLSWH